ncbi:MAG: hypothetical protein ACFFG0_07545 [Candidatus Thorarchaeota archaeon]
MVYIGITGSGEYKDKEFLLLVLERKVDKEKDIIVSGHSPRNPIYRNGRIIRYENTDHWSKQWSISNCKNKPVIFRAIYDTEEYYFKRNGKIANLSNELYAFIPSGKYKSGSWNTVRQFAYKDNFEWKNLRIWNEYRELLKFDEYPNWLKKRIIHIKRMKRQKEMF